MLSYELNDRISADLFAEYIEGSYMQTAGGAGGLMENRLGKEIRIPFEFVTFKFALMFFEIRWIYLFLPLFDCCKNNKTIFDDMKYFFKYDYFLLGRIKLHVMRALLGRRWFDMYNAVTNFRHLSKHNPLSFVKHYVPRLAC